MMVFVKQLAPVNRDYSRISSTAMISMIGPLVEWQEANFGAFFSSVDDEQMNTIWFLEIIWGTVCINKFVEQIVILFHGGREIWQKRRQVSF